MNEESNLEYSLSFHDLLMVDGFKEALETENTKILDAILFTNGMEVKLGYEFVSCIHRTINKLEYNGIRVEGFERIDPHWISTGCASREAQIKAIKDPHLRHELRKMGRERSFDTAFD